MSREMVAMILAGGQGSRLGKLTSETAKPAIPFGGRYRIIDFTLSNCGNSKVYDVGVVTQYQPLELNEHIGNGEPWGLYRREGGVKILQPYSSADGEKWFKGTANAIYQNIAFIDSLNPKYLLVLSGDHIYKMDYSDMLDFHKTQNTALTVAVKPVLIEEASRFGIMNTDSAYRVIEFEEKPETPKNNLASMGIYIFNWDILRNYLVEDQAKERRLEDFGKHVIPEFLKNGERVHAYAFDDYWKDVGTIESLWSSNMDFLKPNHELNIRDENWPIYTRSKMYPPQFIGKNASIKYSMISDGAYIDGDVRNSLISENVKIGENSKVSNSVIMTQTTIGKNVTINYAMIGENAMIGDNANIQGTVDNIAVVGYSEILGGYKDDE